MPTLYEQLKHALAEELLYIPFDIFQPHVLIMSERTANRLDGSICRINDPITVAIRIGDCLNLPKYPVLAKNDIWYVLVWGYIWINRAYSVLMIEP